jgi:hypothetical protein
MVQSFENENMISENMCEMFMNDVREEEYEINPGLQTKKNQNPKMKKRKEKLQAQKKCGNHVIEIPYVGFFCVNNNKDVDVKCP